MSGASRPLAPSDYRSLARFRRGLRAFLAFSEAAARAEGITPTQHQLLLAIKGHPNGDAPSVTDLAESLGRRRHSTVELVARAEEQGLVVVRPDRSDRRRKLVELTPTSDATIERLSAIHREELRGFRADLKAILDDLS